MIATTLEWAPRIATHLTTRSMAEATGLNQTAVVRIWQALGVQPHRTESCRLSTDHQFGDKVRVVDGLYLSRPQNAIVLCVDERNQIQALDRMQPLLPMTPSTPERRTQYFNRHLTCSLFPA